MTQFFMRITTHIFARQRKLTQQNVLRVTTHFFVRITTHIFARIATQLERCEHKNSEVVATQLEHRLAQNSAEVATQCKHRLAQNSALIPTTPSIIACTKLWILIAMFTLHLLCAQLSSNDFYSYIYHVYFTRLLATTLIDLIDTEKKSKFLFHPCYLIGCLPCAVQKLKACI